ncbi:MAG: hypothetical protein BMS9Abin34_527 [Patescibacteria group bacterium]|nr:MAG: hypothetical protein BMS9Abin34_527 [Patescibacteria group bacterium]
MDRFGRRKKGRFKLFARNLSPSTTTERTRSSWQSLGWLNTSEAFFVTIKQVSQLKVAFILTVVVLLLAGGFWYRRSVRSAKELVSSITSGSAVNKVGFQPSFPSSFVEWDGFGVTVVSTGQASDYEIRDRATSKVLASSQILETMSKGKDGKVKKIYFTVQLTPILSPQRSINSWIIKRAAELGPQILSEDEPYTLETIKELFPRGSKWVFVPFLDLETEEVRKALLEYQFYAKAYYGKDLSKIRSYVENGLLGNWSKPIFPLDIFYSFPDF